MLLVSVSHIRNILDTLFELYQEDILDEHGRMRLSRIQLARLDELDGRDASTRMHWTGASDKRALAERLRGVERIPEVVPPEDLNTRLRGYQGLARSHIVVLDALLKLRQVCCDLRLLKLESAGKVKRSAKLEMLMELLPEMIEEKIQVMQARKQALADSLFNRDGGMQANWTDADLDLLFEPLG
jgi:SNF2 family DNA or RNA helicase